MTARTDLAEMQTWPIDAKVRHAQELIAQWHDYWDGQIYVAFSGGKDSCALLHLVRGLYPETPAVFNDTGLEFPELRALVRRTENVTTLRPKRTFREVIQRWGYPYPSKRIADAVAKVRRCGPNSKTGRYYLTGYNSTGKFQPMAVIPKKWRWLLDAPFRVDAYCCSVLKKQPAAAYERSTGRHGMTGEMASDSTARRAHWLQHGCNAYATGRPMSHPLSIWTTADVWTYLRAGSVPYASVYDMGYKRTGCIWCMFGAHLESRPNRFELLRQTHPRLWTYAMDSLGLREVCALAGIPTGTDEEVALLCDAIADGLAATS